MPRTKTTIKRSIPALRSAPIAGAGVVRKSKNTMSNNTTIFRLLKVPKYAKRTLATMCERRNEALEVEMARLKEDWMEQEREIEWLRRELEGVRAELRAADGNDGDDKYKAIDGKGLSMTQKEKEELDSLWDQY